MTIFESKIHDRKANLGRGRGAGGGGELVNPENGDDEADLCGSGAATHRLCECSPLVLSFREQF
jgi:hypothetical protein